MATIDRQCVWRLARNGRAAICDSLARTRLARAWDLLQERDAGGNAMGPLPYTMEALAEFETAHREDPDDFGVVHHLAIAFHARAWDLELAGDPTAAAAWEEALGYWRIIAFSADFWNMLKERFRACDADGDVTLLDDVQKNLLKDLLDVHVEFVRHYCEGNRFDQALSHVGIVKRANIPPAKKRPLVENIFQVMTAGVAAAKLAREFASALIPVERFLAIFPEHLPGLRMHADVCTEWVKGMHFTDHWGEITRLSERAEPHAELLASHPGLEHDSLAKTALVGLGSAFAFQAYHHAATYLTKLQDAQDFDILSEEARTALTLGIPWARRASQVSQEGSQEGGQARDVLANLLGNRGGLWYREFQIRAELVEALITQGGGLFHCEAKIREKRDEAIELLRCAARDVKEAAKWRPNDEAVMQAYGVIKHGLATLGLSDEEEGESTLGEELPSVDRSEAAPPVPATLTMGSVKEASHRTVNIWRRGALEQNPYARTKFRVARVPREVVRHRTVVNLINQTRQIVRGDPAAHAIRGIPVTAAEVLVAEQVLLDPRQRILEELLHHATERLPMERTRELAGEAANLLGADDPGPLSVTKPEALRILATEIGRLCYESAPAPTPSLGSLELELPPPFGRQEEM